MSPLSEYTLPDYEACFAFEKKLQLWCTQEITNML